MIRRHSARKRQQGATLVVGLIMLTLITVMVTSNFTLSTSNLRAVGNAQFRSEALAAANGAIEHVLSSPFTEAPVAEAINVDLNSDGNTDYQVQLATPQCIGATEIAAAETPLSSASLGTAFSTPPSRYETIWDLDATVSDPTDTGQVSSDASVQVHMGVRVLLTKAEYDSVCT